MDFIKSKVGQYLWYKRSTDFAGYKYIATHVEYIIFAAKWPIKYMNMIKLNLDLRNIENLPSYYHGNNIKIKSNFFMCLIKLHKGYPVF